MSDTTKRIKDTDATNCNCGCKELRSLVDSQQAVLRAQEKELKELREQVNHLPAPKP